MKLTVQRDARGLFILRNGARYTGTWLGPGFDAGTEVEAKVCANQHGRHIRVLWNGCVGGDDKPGVVWIRVA